MHLPDGYMEETHWAWSLSRRSFCSHYASTSDWPWEELDDTFLFPMRSPDSPPRRRSRQGSVGDLLFFLEGPSAEEISRERSMSIAGLLAETDETEGIDGNKVDETLALGLGTTPIPIPITVTNPRRRGLGTPRNPAEESLFQRQKKQATPAPETDSGRNLERQRQQRQPLPEVTKPGPWEESETLTEEGGCRCSECLSRQWKEQRLGYTNMQGRETSLTHRTQVRGSDRKSTATLATITAMAEAEQRLATVHR